MIRFTAVTFGSYFVPEHKVRFGFFNIYIKEEPFKTSNVSNIINIL